MLLLYYRTHCVLIAYSLRTHLVQVYFVTFTLPCLFSNYTPRPNHNIRRYGCYFQLSPELAVHTATAYCRLARSYCGTTGHPPVCVVQRPDVLPGGDTTLASNTGEGQSSALARCPPSITASPMRQSMTASQFADLGSGLDEADVTYNKEQITCRAASRDAN